jgi:ABC-2 type transport system permease protein
MISIPADGRTFGFATHARHTGAIAWTSFWAIAKSPAGLVLPAVAMFLVLWLPVLARLKGVSLLPTTPYVLSKLIARVADNPRLPWVLIPLLIIYWAGELVWRERDAGMGEIADATPVREWALVLGKFLGLALVLVGWMALLIAAGVLVQMRMGYFAFELGLYLRILLGLQLVEYLIFALLVLVVHAVVNQKHLGYLAALVAYGVIVFPSFLGIEDHLLIYGSAPRWSYSVVSGFGSSLGPWLWFKVYWAAWALLLAVAARLLWPRGAERSLRARLHLARRRFTRPTAAVAATAVTIILSAAGFVLYNEVDPAVGARHVERNRALIHSSTLSST